MVDALYATWSCPAGDALYDETVENIVARRLLLTGCCTDLAGAGTCGNGRMGSQGG